MADTATDTEKSSAKTAEHINKQREAMRDVVDMARRLSVEYDEHTGAVGSIVKDLTKIEKLQAHIKNLASESRSIELNMANIFRDQVSLEKDSDNSLQNSISLRTKILDIEDKISKAKSKEAKKLGKDKVDLEKRLTTENLYRKNIEERIKLNLKEFNNSKEMLENGRRETSILDKKLNNHKLIKTVSEKIGISTAINTFKTGAWIKLLEEAWQIFRKMDDALFSVRKHLGTFRGESKEIENTTKSLAMDFAGVGVTFEIAATTMNSIVDDFGRLSSHTKNMAATVATFSSQLGISEKTSTGLLKNLAQVSGKTSDSMEGMIGFTKSLSNAAGVSLPKVMEDIAGASDSVRANFRGNTTELIKATVEARRLGLSLESMGKTSESLLDFNSSVNAEMEASVLLGKNLNLNAARRAAFSGDLVKQNEEILKVLKSVGDFEKLNAFQKKSLAAALGKSVEELQSMNQREQERLWILQKGTKEQKQLLADYEKQKKLREGEAKDLGKIAEDRIKQENHQQRVNALQQQFHKLIMELSGPILDAIEPLMALAVKWMPTIFEGFSKLLIPATILFTVFKLISSPIDTILLKLMMWSKYFDKFMLFVGNLASRMAFLGKAVAWVATVFGKWLNPIGWVITAFQLIYSLFKRFSDIEFVKGDWTGNIWKGIEAIGGALYDTLIKPFVDVYDWIKKKLMGNSPSEIGTGIVNGLIAVGSMILKALTYPFTSAFTFITELFGKIPEFITSVFKRGFDFVTKLPGMGLLTKAIDTFSGNKTADVNQKVETVQTKQDDTNRLILEKLTELTNLMKSGGIAINMDGRRVSEALAHASSR
jgi:hypothetical protein